MGAAIVGHIFEIALLLFLLGCSAFFSGSETALFSLTRERLKDYERTRTAAGDRILALMRDPKLLLATVLVGNMTVNVLFFSVSFRLADAVARAHSRWAGGAVGVGALLAVIVFGEVAPKGVAVTRPAGFARAVAFPLYAFHRAASPLSRTFGFLMGKMSERIAEYAEHDVYVKPEELKMLVDMAARQQVIKGMIPSMIQEVVDIGRTRVKQIMVPRVDIAAFRLNDSREAFLDLARRTRHKRYLVYKRSMDDISTALLTREALLSPDEPLERLQRPVVFVPETKTVEDLLKQFREQRQDFAVVVDEYGGTAGIVTIEDVIEEVIGEIKDEYDLPTDEVKRLSENEYLVPGDLPLDAWREMFGRELPSASVDTVGGFVAALLDRMPRVGDSVVFEGVELSVTAMRRRRVLQVRLRLLGPEGEAGEVGAG